MLENRTLESELTEQVKEAQPDEITEVPPMTPEEIAETQDRIIEKVENGEIVLTTDREKGNFGEMKTDQEMRKKGYERISGGAVTSLDEPGHQGLDGVYCNPNGKPPILIADAKYNTAQLHKNTADGPQLSWNWTDKRLDADIGKEKADEIRLAKLSGEVVCVVVLRPTKVRSLYCQMVGRGTRIAPGKKDLLLLDFLWHTQRHELCRPASLICGSEEVTRQMTEDLEQAGGPVDILEAEEKAASDVVARREGSLAKQLSEMRSRKRKLVDPLQFEMSIQAEDLSGYTPSFGWEMGPPSEEQRASLEKMGIFPDEIGTAGKASLLLDRLRKRRAEGLTTPKQIRFLEGRGFCHVGRWQFTEAKRLIDRIAANGWRVPGSIDPAEYTGGGA